MILFFFFQAEDGIRDVAVTGVQTCALPIYRVGVTAQVRHDLQADRIALEEGLEALVLGRALGRPLPTHDRLAAGTASPPLVPSRPGVRTNETRVFLAAENAHRH